MEREIYSRLCDDIRISPFQSFPPLIVFWVHKWSGACMVVLEMGIYCNGHVKVKVQVGDIRQR